MSIHLEAEKGQVADKVILPGDPLRAKYIAERFLSDAVCYNRVRGMLGFTGLFRGERVSVQGSGMGLPSLSIYVNELINEYAVSSIIRAGSCGALQPNVRPYDIVLAQSASTDSSMNRIRFNGMDYAPCADFSLLYKAYQICEEKKVLPHIGSIFATDSFYHPDKENWKLWAAYGTVAVEMESSALYTLCARANVKALSVLTVSDSLVSGASTTSKEREQSFDLMAEICLETICS